MLINTKPARKLGLWTSILVAAWLTGCQQTAVNPPITEALPSAEVIPEVASERKNTRPFPDDGIRRSSRELSRTELGERDNDRFMSSIQNNNAPSMAIDPVKQAQAELDADRPEASIDALQGIQIDNFDNRQRANILQLKAESLTRLDLESAALKVRAERLQYLTPSDLDRELRSLTRLIEGLPESSRYELSLGTDALAGLIGALDLDAATDTREASRWLQRFGQHPLLQSQLAQFQFLKKIQLPEAIRLVALLPLSGDLANAGKAIRDGIIYQFKERSKTQGIALDIRDTETMTETDWNELAAETSYDLIIGPLRRNHIARLLAARPKSPVLALNRIDTQSAGTDASVYSLSLSIEDDAESAVDFIGIAERLPRVLTFYADTELGRRASVASRNQVSRIGGTLAGDYVLDSEKPEITIAQAFGVTDSETRRRELSRAINLPLELTPRIREDLSAVLIQTDNSKGRQLRPLLEFYYLKDTPVFLVGAYRKDIAEMTEDFKHTYLLVTPWDLDSPVREALAQRPWTQGPFGTLTGIGADALEVAARLGLGESLDFPGQTGHLSLGRFGIIERRLSILAIDGQERMTQVAWNPSLQPLRYEDSQNAR